MVTPALAWVTLCAFDAGSVDLWQYPASKMGPRHFSKSMWEVLILHKAFTQKSRLSSFFFLLQIVLRNTLGPVKIAGPSIKFKAIHGTVYPNSPQSALQNHIVIFPATPSPIKSYAQGNRMNVLYWHA